MASGVTKMLMIITIFMGSASNLQLPSEATTRMAVDLEPPAPPSPPIAEDCTRLQLAEIRRGEVHLGLYRAAVQRTKVVTCKQIQDSTRRESLSRSTVLLEDNLYASKVGWQRVASPSGRDYGDARTMSMLLDVHGGKAPRTINKRIGGLQHYVIWACRRSSGRSAFPMKELLAYDNLCYPREEGASTAPAGVVMAVNFSFYVSSIESEDLVSASARAKRVAHVQSATERPTAQRHPPTSRQASALEETVSRAPTAQDRNFAGFCMFLCLSRASSSDAMHGKALLDDMQTDPRALGYHVASDEASFLTVGRDNQSDPLRWVERVLEAIRSGEFAPDQTRSGRFKEGSDSINKAVELFNSLGQQSRLSCMWSGACCRVAYDQYPPERFHLEPRVSFVRALGPGVSRGQQSQHAPISERQQRGTRAKPKPAKIDALEPVRPVVVEVDRKAKAWLQALQAMAVRSRRSPPTCCTKGSGPARR
jgi:hypothetical protein